MKYIIHGYISRKHYIDEYLIPALNQQGIKPDVYMDNGGEGNLYATMNCFYDAGDAWHIQDDVLTCRDFAERTKSPEGITCGFCSITHSIPEHIGKVSADDMWYSFPCIYIPGDIARGCAEWFFTRAIHIKGTMGRLISQRIGDDTFFREYIRHEHPKIPVYNMAPNLVEHIDYLLDGSIANKLRKQLERSAYWDDNELIEELKCRLNMSA